MRESGVIPTPPARSARNLAGSLGLLIASILVTLLVLEGVIRVVTAHAARASWESQLARTHVAGAPAPDGEARLGNIIRPSRHRRIVYELLPNLDVTFVHAPLRTNADGFRGPARPLAKPQGTVRIVGLGDSVMFGWGVAYEECYLARLESTLSTPSTPWEAINLAVPGYNTAMELATFEEKGLAYHPDLVILNFVGNDLGLPNFIVAQDDYLDLTRSFLWDFVSGRLRRQAGQRLAMTRRDQRRAAFAREPGRVPKRYRDMVGLPAFERSLERLAELSREHGFEVVVLAHPEALGYVRRTTSRLGLPLVETADAIDAAAAVHGERALVVAEHDPHPSALGHAVIAQVLADDLRRRGVVARLTARASAH